MTHRCADHPPALVAEAKTKPGGWVYEIVGDYGPDDAVPPTAIRGAWKVDDQGQIVGYFLPKFGPIMVPAAVSVPGRPAVRRAGCWSG